MQTRSAEVWVPGRLDHHIGVTLNDPRAVEPGGGLQGPPESFLVAPQDQWEACRKGGHPLT
jgi:hypothetical protein